MITTIFQICVGGLGRHTEFVSAEQFHEGAQLLHTLFHTLARD